MKNRNCRCGSQREPSSSITLATLLRSGVLLCMLAGLHGRVQGESPAEWIEAHLDEYVELRAHILSLLNAPKQAEVPA